jgi:hypothetical protein
MKNLLAVLLVMVTGLSFAQDLSSFTVTAKARNYNKVDDGVWTQTPNGIVFKFDKESNTIGNFNSVLDAASELLENNKEDLSEFEDYTSDVQISEVMNRYDKEFDNLFELTRLGGGLSRAYKIIGNDKTIIIYIMLHGDDYSLLLKTK